MAATLLHSAFPGTCSPSLSAKSAISQKAQSSSVSYRRTRQLKARVVSQAQATAGSTDLVLVDHFARLGVPRDATNVQIAAAYKSRCKEVTDYEEVPEVARKQLENLATSFDVLITEEEKRLYLWGLMRMEKTDKSSYIWPYEADPTQGTISGTPRPQTPEDLDGTTTLGYFFAGWFVLSIVLSLSLK